MIPRSPPLSLLLCFPLSSQSHYLDSLFQKRSPICSLPGCSKIYFISSHMMAPWGHIKEKSLFDVGGKIVKDVLCVLMNCPDTGKPTQGQRNLPSHVWPAVLKKWLFVQADLPLWNKKLPYWQIKANKLNDIYIPPTSAPHSETEEAEKLEVTLVTIMNPFLCNLI